MNKKLFREFLNKLGVPIYLRGYDYLVSAIEILETRPWKPKTCDLYEAVAEKYKVSYRAVERSLRYAKGKVRNPEVIGLDKDVFEEGICNSEFIYRVFTYYK